MKTVVRCLTWAAPFLVTAACSTEPGGEATVCAEGRFRENWGTFPACCEDIGDDGHLYVYGQLDAEFGGGLVIRRYYDRDGLPCRNGDGTTGCGCESGATDACEEDDVSCEYGQTGSAEPNFYGDLNAVVFVPKQRSDSNRCGADDNGDAEGGTHPGPASAEEYTGRQTAYDGLTGTVPWAYTSCSTDGTPGLHLALRATCTGALTGTVTWGTHSVTCDSTTPLAEKAFWAPLDGQVEVTHSATGWQGWADACTGTGSCAFQITEDSVATGQFGSQ